MRPIPKSIECVDDDMAAIYRAMSGAKRLQIASDLFASARSMLLHHLRTEHPDWSDDRVTRATAERLSHGAR